MFFKLLLLLTVFFPTETILIDKIAAVVNNEIITLSDLDKAIQFFPNLRKKDESDNEFYQRTLNDLINYKVIYLEYNQEFNLAEEDHEEVQIPILKKAGSLNKLIAQLRRFDMKWEDFKKFIKEKVLYEKVLKEKLQLNIIVHFKEIEQFYQIEYLPIQKKLNIPPKTLIEMSPVIEKHLKKIKTQLELFEWIKERRSFYQIENKLGE